MPEDERAQLPVDLIRRHRKDLERPAGGDAERLEGPAVEKLEHGGLNGRPFRGNGERRREVGDAEDGADPLPHLREIGLGVEVQDQAAGEPPDAAHAAARRGREQVPSEPSEEQRSVAALEADLVVVDDDARRRRPPPRATAPARVPSGAWDVVGRRSGGISTLGGFRGIGFRGRAGRGARFLGTGTSVLRAGERRHARVPPGEAVHLHAAPGRAVERAQDAVVDGPAPSPDGPIEPFPPERGRPVERLVETAARRNSRSMVSIRSRPSR